MHSFFQELTENDSPWIPVLSVDGSNKNPNPITHDQLSFVNKKISVVGKALKIGVPVLVALFTGTFFIVGFSM